jgi:hypothetical protein
MLAVAVKYHDRTKPETPRPDNMVRYLEVTKRSRAFRPRAADALKVRSDLCVMWLEHLLLLSMLQHPSGSWAWGRYVVVHSSGNSDFADACERYRSLLANDATFGSTTTEDLLDADALPARTVAALRERYLPG